jgi:hypothetical protein
MPWNWTSNWSSAVAAAGALREDGVDTMARELLDQKDLIGVFAAQPDWPNASQGDPAADVCRTYVLLRSVSSELASAYVDAYSRVSGESRDAILNWLPFVAAARLSEGVPEVDDLMKMLDR